MIESVTKPKCNQCVCMCMLCLQMYCKLLQIKRSFSCKNFTCYFSSFNFVVVCVWTQFFVCWTIFWFSFLCCHTIEKHTLQPFLIGFVLVAMIQSCYAATNWQHNLWKKMHSKHSIGLFGTKLWLLCSSAVFYAFAISIMVAVLPCGYCTHHHGCVRCRRHHHHHQNMSCDCYFAVFFSQEKKKKNSKRKYFEFSMSFYLRVSGCVCFKIISNIYKIRTSSNELSFFFLTFCYFSTFLFVTICNCNCIRTEYVQYSVCSMHAHTMTQRRL